MYPPRCATACQSVRGFMIHRPLRLQPPIRHAFSLTLTYSLTHALSLTPTPAHTFTSPRQQARRRASRQKEGSSNRLVNASAVTKRCKHETKRNCICSARIRCRRPLAHTWAFDGVKEAKMLEDCLA
ncbi:hypothetical protein LZ31DRAFT_375077 [Colletotrichum somersetense]|nr:hypothetical protein LZ31DRAFT_375077 [Colletotrichum somersetense]